MSTSTTTVAELLATDSGTFEFDDFPPDVINQAKLSLLDGIAIGIGGYTSEPSQIIQALIREVGGPAESTVFVSGLKTSCLYATLANGAMMRYLDYMDRTFLSRDAVSNMGHHGEAIAPILAVGERQHASGRKIITAIVLSYELLNKVSSAADGNHGVLDRRGWVPETVRVPCVMALMAGRMMGLTEVQLANAVGIACSFMPGVLGIIHSEKEELTMSRNLRFPWSSHNGILAAMLAGKGFEGPTNVFEGHTGIVETVGGGEIDLRMLREPRAGWTILNTWIKNFSAEGRMHGHIEATLALVNEHDLRPEDVAHVRIRTTAHCLRRMGSPATRQHPRTKYTADHSCYYTTAVAIVDRSVGPEQFSEKKLNDPRVLKLLDVVSVEADPRLEEYISPGIVDITTTDGRQLTKEVLRPKGHPMNPMRNADVEAKFDMLARPLMSETRRSEIVTTVRELETLKDIRQLMALLVVND